jgi:hypothetical protein
VLKPINYLGNESQNYNEILPHTHQDSAYQKPENRAGGVAQVIECLLSKYEVLSSNHNTKKQTNKKPRTKQTKLPQKT